MIFEVTVISFPHLCLSLQKDLEIGQLDLSDPHPLDDDIADLD